MGREHGVEEWLPGGIALRVPAAADTDPVDRASVDLNAADFEGLLALGLSVGQAARFISQRERRGGLRAVSDIDGFYGLAPGVRDILRWSGRVQGQGSRDQGGGGRRGRRRRSAL